MSGKQTLAILQRLLVSTKFQTDIREHVRLTVDDSGLSIHCMCYRGLVLLVCTAPEYPQRLVFPPTSDGAIAVGLLAHIGDIAVDTNIPAPEVGAVGIQVYTLPPRVAQALERVFADHEDIRSRDPILRVQAEVDEVPNPTFPVCVTITCGPPMCIPSPSPKVDLAPEDRCGA